MLSPLRQSLMPLVLPAAVAAGAGGNSVTYLGDDTTTQGNWIGVYGADGYNICDGSNPPESTTGSGILVSMPAYASFGSTSSASEFVWSSSTSDVRALLRNGGSGTNRIASTFYSNGSETFDLTISGGSARAVRIYFLDWDLAREVNVTITDGDTGSTLWSYSDLGNAGSTINHTDYHNGVYLGWSISGHVKITITQVAGDNGTISAFFFN